MLFFMPVTPLSSPPDGCASLMLAYFSHFILSLCVEAGISGSREQRDLQFSPPHGERSRPGLAESLVRDP